MTQLGAAGTTSAATVAGSATTTGLTAGALTLNGIQVGASIAGALPGQSAGSASSIATAINATTGTSGVTATASATAASGLAATAFTAIAANSFSINGVSVGAVAAGTDAKGQGANVAAAINLVSGQSGVTAAANATTGAITLTAADGRNISVTASAYNAAGTVTQLTQTNLLAQTGFAATLSDSVVGTAAVTAGAITATVNGVAIAGVTGTTALASAQNFVTAFNNKAATTTLGQGISGITASTDSTGVVSLTSNGTVAKILIASSTANLTAANYAAQHGSVNLSSTNANGIVLSGGTPANAGFTAGTTAAATVSTVTSLSTVNISTAAGATAALTTIDGAIAQVNASRSALGAYQNRFTSVVSTLQTTTENLTASRSRIQDTDFAAETASLSRAQILQQAGTAMLAQANQLPSQVMTLLR
jgi:flagellin